MHVHISDASLTDDLVRYFRRHDFLAVKRGPATVEVLPINTVSPRADRARVKRWLDDWHETHPGVETELVP